MDLGPVELPVALIVGDPATAEPTPLGSVHLALRTAARVDVGDALGASGGLRLVAVDPDDLRHQLADLLQVQADTLRNIVEGEEVPGAAAPR